jgi:hypothetical protein
MLCLPLRGGFLLPGGCAAPRRLLAAARCAPRLPRPRPSSAPRAGPPRCPHEAASPTPRPVRALGPRGRGSHGRWHPLGGLNTPHPGGAPWRTGGGSKSAGAAGGTSLRSPRAPRVRIGVGRRWPRPSVSCEGGEQRGSRRRGALRGRGRRSVRPQRLGRREAGHRPPRHRQNKKASRSERRENPPAGQEMPRSEREEGDRRSHPI